MPQGKLQIADQFQDSFEVILRNPISSSGKICAISHAGCDGVSVEHTSWKLITWRPGVTESVWPQLVSFPKHRAASLLCVELLRSTRTPISCRQHQTSILEMELHTSAIQAIR